MPLPSRILTAVPQTWQARLEIAKAIRKLAEQDEQEQLQKALRTRGYLQRLRGYRGSAARSVSRMCIHPALGTAQGWIQPR